MSTVELTRDNFEEVVKTNETVFVDFWAEWCGPCKMFGPVYEQAAESNPDLVFGKVDTEVQQELAGAFGIMSIPTLMVLRQGVILFSQPGALPAPVLDELIGKVREVDMVEVHRAVAEQQTQQAQQGPGADGDDTPGA
jgi:thioredoxin 1